MEGLSPKLASELDSFSFPSGWAPAHAHLWGILFPLSSFDPLKLHNVEKKKHYVIMVSTMILTIALTESVSQHGISIPL